MNTITEKALIARINRRLAHDGKIVRTLRGRSGLADLGRHYTVNVEGNDVLDRFVDLGGLARALGVFRESERVRIVSREGGGFREVHADGTVFQGGPEGGAFFPPADEEA